MHYTIRMGIPDMEDYWGGLCRREAEESLDKNDLKIFKKLLKTFYHLGLNPRYPGLCSHEISVLSSVAGFKIWESCVENNTPSAGSIFWAYGPGRAEITGLGFEPHPEDGKKAGYARVKLSELPPL